jgi:hypothetical protein
MEIERLRAEADGQYEYSRETGGRMWQAEDGILAGCVAGSEVEPTPLKR